MPHIAAADRDSLILDHLRLVTHMAGQYRSTARRVRLDWDDLIQEGRVGLCVAAASYDPTGHTAAFSTYARFWILAHFIRAVRQSADRTGLDLDRLPSRPRPPTLVPLFPVPLYDPMSECPHHGPIRPGSDLCCMICHRSGRDDHPALQRDRATDPKPEQKPAPPQRPSTRETRRQRRLRLFGAAAPA